MKPASQSLFISQNKNSQSTLHVQTTAKTGVVANKRLVSRLCFCLIQTQYGLPIGEVIQMYPDNPNEVRMALHGLRRGRNHERIRKAADRLLNELDQYQSDQ